MNILFISHYGSLYGANRSLLLLLDGLVANNINPLVLVPQRGPFIDELKKRGIPYYIVKYRTWMGERNKLFIIKATLKFLLNLAHLPTILFYAIKFKPSIIYSNSSVTPIGIYLSLILKIPHIWHIRELGKLHYNWDYDFGQKYFLFFMHKSDAIISISEYVKENLFPGEWSNLTVINNGVFSDNGTDFLTIKNVSPEKKIFTFLIMSVIHPSKGLHDAIYAVDIVKKDVRNIKLVIYGESVDKLYKGQLDDLVTKLNLNGEVSFKGFTASPFEIYKSVNAVLVCSKNEAWGRVAAEAMISERPVIGYNSGGTKEIIMDNFNGLLYNNIEELAACMKIVNI